MLIGLAGFIVASAAVGVAPTVGLGDRGAAGAGRRAGLLTPQNSGLIQQLFRGSERGRAFGDLRAHRLDLLGARPGARRPDHRAGRRGERLALALPGQRADRAGRDGRRAPDGAAPRAAREAGERPRSTSTWSAPCCSALAVLCLLCPLVSVEGGAPAAAAPAGAGGAAASAGLRARGSGGRRAAAAPRCSTWRCCGARPATSTGSPSARSTSPASPGSSWCCRSTSRTGSGYSPLTAGLLLTPFALGSALTAPLAGRLVSRHPPLDHRRSRWR